MEFSLERRVYYDKKTILNELKKIEKKIEIISTIFYHSGMKQQDVDSL